jgi:hypothetical protein
MLEASRSAWSILGSLPYIGTASLPTLSPNTTLHINHDWFLPGNCQCIMSPASPGNSKAESLDLRGTQLGFGPRFSDFRCFFFVECCHDTLVQDRNFLFIRNHLPISFCANDPLTHSWSWALHEKLLIVQLLQNFTAFYGTRKFITVFTKALHWSLSWTRSI